MRCGEVMTTIPCNLSQFNKACSKFMREIGNKNNTQESISGLYKGLTLHYLGLQDLTDDEVETAAIIFKVMTDNALARGWSLDEHMV